MKDSTSDPAPTPLKTCATCLHHSPSDACCTLTGETRHKVDAACMEWTDGTCGVRGELDAWGEG